jgi:hypothetical protein
MNIKIKPAYFLDGQSNLVIELDDIKEDTQLLWIRTELGFVSYSSLSIEGEKLIKEDVIQFSSQPHMTISWAGYAGNEIEIAFQGTQEDQFLHVYLNDSKTEKNLQSTEIVIIHLKREISFYAYIPMIISVMVSCFSSLIFLMVLLSELKIDFANKFKRKQYSWLFYGLPVLFTSTLMLLIFWPGFFTNDSLWMWNQAVTKNFSSWQSTSYEYFISLFVNINYGVSIIIGLQVLLFCIIFAWTLSTLENIGVPKTMLWIISIVMALFPMNNLYLVTFWKDIPYAIFFLAFTTSILKITFSDGHWGTIGKNWIFLIFTGIFVSALRHNGWPSIIATFFLLVIIYRKYWRIYLTMFILMAISILILQTSLPFNNSGEKAETGQVNLVLLHHIAAHVDSGTKLNETEAKYLNSFLPLNEWDYDPCYVGTISYNRDFNRKSFLTNTDENIKLTSMLFFQNPLVDASHMLKSGELAYKFLNTNCSMKSLHGFSNINAGNEDWVVENAYGIQSKSKIPGLIQPILKYYSHIGIFDGIVDFYLYPAFWLIISIFSITVAAIRTRKIKILLVVFPVLIQSLVLFLIGFAPAYRYYYSNCLVGIVISALCFMSKNQSTVVEK